VHGHNGQRLGGNGEERKEGVEVGGKNELFDMSQVKLYISLKFSWIGTCHSVKFLYLEPIELYHAFFAFLG
jgi:hypothetical protein